MASVSYDKEYWVNELVWLSKDALLMCAGRQKADVQEKGILQVIKVAGCGSGVARRLLPAAVASTKWCLQSEEHEEEDAWSRLPSARARGACHVPGA